jgi:hypothetical protein
MKHFIQSTVLFSDGGCSHQSALTEKGWVMIEIGFKAPEFCLTSSDERDVCLGDFEGKWVILYFYPKDNTSG